MGIGVGVFVTSGISGGESGGGFGLSGGSVSDMRMVAVPIGMGEGMISGRPLPESVASKAGDCAAAGLGEASGEVVGVCPQLTNRPVRRHKQRKRQIKRDIFISFLLCVRRRLGRDVSLQQPEDGNKAHIMEGDGSIRFADSADTQCETIIILYKKSGVFLLISKLSGIGKVILMGRAGCVILPL